MTKRDTPVRGRWTLIGLLATATFINYLDRGSLAVALPMMSRDLGLGPAQQGIALSAFFWTYAAMQIPMGWSPAACCSASASRCISLAA